MPQLKVSRCNRNCKKNLDSLEESQRISTAMSAESIVGSNRAPVNAIYESVGGMQIAHQAKKN